MWSELNDLISPVTSLLPYWLQESEEDRTITLNIIAKAMERAKQVQDTVLESEKDLENSDATQQPS